MSDWSKFFKPKVYDDPDKAVSRSVQYRVDNWTVIQQFDEGEINHRLKVFNRSKVVYSKWCSRQEFAWVDLDKEFGSQRGWSVYGCSPFDWWHTFPCVFKVQLALTEDEQPLQPAQPADLS